MRRLQPLRAPYGRRSRDSRARGLIAVLSTIAAPRFLAGDFFAYPIERARTNRLTHANIARRMSWPKANKKVIANPRNQKKKRSKQLLPRRAKRAQRPGGSRRSDQAKRNRDKQSFRRVRSGAT